MRTSFFFAMTTAVLLVCSACDKITVGNNLKRSDTSRKEGGRTGDNPSGIFLTAIDFDGTYDWRKDSDYGHAEGRIILFMEDEPVMSLKAGGNSEISTAADLHHFSGGHIYTEYFNGTHTVYKRDGEECLRVEGKETVKGILTRESSIYVLSERFPERGFVLREDWKDIMSRKSGTVHGSPTDPAFGSNGALYDDMGSLCFIYFKQNTGAGQWFVVTDGEEKEVALQTSVSKVFDLRRFNGSNSMVTEYADGRVPVLQTGGRIYDLTKTLDGTSAASDYRLYNDNGKITVRGTLGDDRTGIWYYRQLLTQLPGDCTLHDGDNYISRVDGIVESICLGSRETINLQKRYKLMMPGCVEWNDGSPILALTPEGREDKPAIWRNGILKEYGFNGYFTSVSGGE